MSNYYVENILNTGIKKCYLGGWSLGGILTLEIAMQLQGKNIEVEDLYIFDTHVLSASQLKGVEDMVSLKVLKSIVDPIVKTVIPKN